MKIPGQLLICILLFSNWHFVSQTTGIEITIDAGPDLIINWEETQSARLAGIVSVKETSVGWRCGNNPEVQIQKILTCFPSRG